jgi:hypothetical protein
MGTVGGILGTKDELLRDKISIIDTLEAILFCLL